MADERSTTLTIRPAGQEDYGFVVTLMEQALSPYYGGNHRAHAERIFGTHLSGGRDPIGHFSFEQKMFILTDGVTPLGLIHLVGKRQGTYKISPIIVRSDLRHRLGLGSLMLEFAERYAIKHRAREIYCTVAEQNAPALAFFIRHGYTAAGRSASHYKIGITEIMLYKPLAQISDTDFDRPNISVVPCSPAYESQARALLMRHLPHNFQGIDDMWIDALFNGYQRRDTADINLKYKLIFVATDRAHNVLGVAGATPKKGEPIKVMPFIASSYQAFVALLTDIPFALRPYGRKLYIHITPDVRETMALQQRGWHLDAALPAAYHSDQVTQQWSFDIGETDFMRTMRVKQKFLDLIRSGAKTLEVRVGYPTMKSLHAGERVRLTSHRDAENVMISAVRRYPSFEEMLKVEDASRIAPDEAPDRVGPLLRQIYPPDRESLGVIVLEIAVEK